MLLWLYKKNQDLKLRTLFLITSTAHILFLVFIFFIYNYSSTPALILSNTGSVPVVFMSRAAATTAGSGAGTGSRVSARVVKQKVKRIAQRKNSRMRFKSSYAVSSLKSRPKPQAQVVRPEPVAATMPLFSPKKQVIKDVQKVREVEQKAIPEIAEEIAQEVHGELLGEASVDEIISVGEATTESFYDPVYGALSQHWSVPAGLPKGLVCVVIIMIDSDGTSTHEFVRKSGVLAFDTAVRTTLLRACYPQTIKKYTKKVEFRS